MGELRARSYELAATAVEHVRQGDVARAVSALQELEFGSIDEHVLLLTDGLLAQVAQGRKVVATFDPKRQPAPGEQVIVYGNYPHMFDNLVHNNPMRRHVADFWKFEHEEVEYDRRWDGIDRILIINGDRRVDRWDQLLRDLAAVRAPLHRVTRVSAATPEPGEEGALGGTLGCLRSHIEALRVAESAGDGTVLVLEDDFSFTTSVEDHLNDLAAFLERRYDYWVCLLGTSKYGRVVPLDDLVSRSFQEVTNAEAYLASPEGRAQVLPVFKDALGKLKETGETDVYAADRCWTVLQPSGKFLVFRRKFGFQRSSVSDIYGSISRYMD